MRKSLWRKTHYRMHFRFEPGSGYVQWRLEDLNRGDSTPWLYYSLGAINYMRRMRGLIPLDM